MYYFIKFSNFQFFFFFFSSRMNYIILKKVGKIGGNDRQIRSRLKHVLSCIDKGVKFEITDVKV